MRFQSKSLRAIACTAVLSVAFSVPAFANWSLDNNESSLSFVSTKKDEIAEAHHFEKLTGQIDKNGKASLAIDLASVNTNIAIRDERMRDFLFETTKFSQARFSTDIDLAFLKAMAVGEQKQLMITGELALHGQSQSVNAMVNIAKLASGKVTVTTVKPILVNARQYKLAAGVAKLKELAGLPSISNAVPVTFTLTYSKD